MRLNNTIKEKVKIFLVEKAFPKTKEENLLKNARIAIEGSDLLDTRRKLYQLYPEYIRQSSIIRFERKIRYSFESFDRAQREDIGVSFNFATKVGEWGYLEFNPDLPEFREKYPLISNDVTTLMNFEKEKQEYKKSIDNILGVVQSSTPLINLIPECAEFFKAESHGVSSLTSIVPTKDLKTIRDSLDRAEAEEAKNE